MNNELELISRHFDDANSAADLAALEAHLISDPAVALEFARTARVHALLEAAAPPRAAGRAVRLRRWLAYGAAAALVAAGAGAVIFHFSKPADAPALPQIVHDNSALPFERKPLPPGVNLRTVKKFAAAAPLPPVSLELLLKNFYVHADPDGLTVPEALRELERAIGEANLLNRPELAALRFTAGASVIPPIRDQDEPKLRFTPTLDRPEPDARVVSPLQRPFTIKEYLDICGLYRAVTQQPGGVSYGAAAAAVHPLDGTPHGTRLETRTFRVSPDFIGPWHDKDTSSARLRHLLWSRLGVAVGRQGTVSFSKDLAAITVTDSAPRLERIEQVLNVCAQRKAVQHYLITKYIRCQPEQLAAGFDAATGQLLNDAEFQKLCRQLSQTPGVELISAPSVIVRPGQNSAIQIQCEVPGSVGVAPLSSDWLGLQQEMLTTCVGETIQISGMVDLGLPVSSGLAALVEIKTGSNGLLQYAGEGAKHHRTGYDLWIPNRSTALFTLDVDTKDPGVVLVCITAQIIDVAGIPVGP